MPFKNNLLFLAPLAGISETVFRKLCRANGADCVITEMISAEGLLRNSKKTLRLMEFDDTERPVGIQLFGSDPDRMAAAATWIEAFVKPDFINLNSGCPVPKVVSRNAGAALLKDPMLFERIVSAMAKAIKIPLTVKLRSGWNTNQWVDVEFARIAEAAGAQSIILHPRSKTMGYTGHSFWERIAVVKKAVAIPVIGNGDIVTALDARKMRDETGCDGLMIGRGALGNPWLFNQAKEALAGGQVPEITNRERCRVVLEHIRNYRAHCGEAKANRDMRKQVAWYLHGLKNAAVYRDRVFRSKSTIELEALVKEALCGE
jgi:tRNA-dihydrouridine synthase B